MELFSAAMSALGVSRRIFELLDARPTLPLEGGRRLEGVKGRIELKDVSFSYPSRPDVPVLHGVSISVEQGQVLALCGASGGGKSSIIALLERWYDPSGGVIEIDGVPLTSLDPSWWRSSVRDGAPGRHARSRLRVHSAQRSVRGRTWWSRGGCIATRSTD